MPNPPKPVEMKLLQGNPGKRGLRLNDAIAPLEYGHIEPPDGLRAGGLELWHKIFGAGEIWISIRTDTTLVEQVCKQIDRRDELEKRWWENPTDRNLQMHIIETEKEVKSGLSLLGFSPADRTRLGLVSARTKSKLEEVLALRKEKMAQ